MKVWVNRDNEVHYMEFDNEDIYHIPRTGHPVTPLKVIGSINSGDKAHGTTIEFYPDFTIMEKSDWDHQVILARLKQLAYLNKGIKIVLIDQLADTTEE
jgi:DNA gyrase subunit B